MREQHPEKYEKTMTLKVSAGESQQLKMLAVRESKSIKAVLLEALDRAFPGWRETK